MSEKTAHDHHHHHILWPWKLSRRLCGCLIITTFIILLTIFLVWASLQPQKPSFTLQDATIFNLSVAAPNVISATLQITVNSHNPNSHIGIYYDRMEAYAAYHHQQITYPTAIPAVYQGHRDDNVWSPFIYGTAVPVAPYNGLSLSQDQANGAVALVIRINGRVKWRVGNFVSGRYHLHVSCPAYIPIGNSKNTGIVVGDGIKYQLSQSCSVNV